ncbi:MAG: sigma-70 family RNA polymerase sigma factor [Gammaproteobacteria bacterium]|nr:sigma-70 family RNA polymerase sigma factor [Gammaproteobacteria bacterium]
MADQATKAFFGDGIERHLDALYSVAIHLTRSNADAEDLVAEAVAKAWAAIDTLNDQARFRPWIFRILHNTFVSDYRKKSVRPLEASIDSNDNAEDDLANLLGEQSDDFLVWWSNPEREFFNNLLGQTLMDALDDIPDAFSTVIVLVNVEGFTYDETAEVLGIAPGTVRSRMKRGRTMLQKALWHQRPGLQEGIEHDA